MGSEDLWKRLRHSAIKCLKVNMPNIVDMVSNTDYFAATVGVGNKKELYEEGISSQDKTYNY